MSQKPEQYATEQVALKPEIQIIWPFTEKVCLRLLNVTAGLTDPLHPSVASLS